MITKAVQEKINRIRNYIIRHPEHYIDEISKKTDISIMSIRRLEGSGYFKLGDRYYTRFEKKVKDLYKNYSKTEIAHMLGVSTTKISVAISLITKRDPYRKQKHIKKRKIKKGIQQNQCVLR